VAGQHGRRAILVSEVPASSVRYGWAGKYSALRTQIHQDSLRRDPVDSEGVPEEMGCLVPWVALLPEIFGVLVLSAVLDTQDIGALAQEEPAVGSSENLAEPVLLTHWNLSSVALCLV